MNLMELAAALDATDTTIAAARRVNDMQLFSAVDTAQEIAADLAAADDIAPAAPSRADRIAACVAAIGNPAHARNTFAQDVVGKFRRFGALSDRQLAALEASMARDRDFAARAAAEPAGDAPDGKATITGDVVSMKWHTSAFGESHKMTVKIANGARVWMTAPSGHGIEKGDRVTVSATFTRSDTDRSFAFGKRPRLIAREAATVAA